MLVARPSLFTACLCCLLWACGKGQVPLQEELLFCDDKLVEDAVDSALLNFNGQLTSGNHFALHQILEAKKVVNESVTELFLRFTSRQTDCPIGGDKLWRDCEYFPYDTQPPRSCRAHVFVTEGASDVSLVDCASEPLITAERAPCLGCPQEISPDSDDLKEPVRFSVAKANNAHNEVFLFILRNVVFASRQVVAGFRYQLKFNMLSSNCTKDELKEVTEECLPQEKPTYVRCNSSVDVAPWRHEVPTVNSVNCEPGQFMATRRRPPGWTPLRTFEVFSTTQAPKKESSEEEQDMPQTRPTFAPEGEMPSGPISTTPSPQTSSTQIPFNCPSKPWKQFIPQTPPPSTSWPTSKPEADGLFSDLDLLG